MLAHTSRDRLYNLLRNRFYWYGMYRDVKAWVDACIPCKAKVNQPLNHGLLVPIKTVKPFEMVGMDIIGPLTMSKDGFKYVLVCIDMFTSWPEAEPIKSIDALEVSSKFFRMIISRHGCPDIILTDQGKQFTSKLFNRVCKQYGIEHRESTAYHHQTNGKVEKFNQFLEKALATVVDRNQSNWSLLVDHVLFLYRTTLNRVLSEIPFYLIYGRDVTLPQDLMLDSKSNSKRTIESEDINQFKAHLIKVLNEAYQKLNLRKDEMQRKYKNYYDKFQKEVNFEIGDLVMVYVPTNTEGLSYKLLSHWDGPWEVTKKIDSVTYRIKKVEDHRTITQPVHVKRLYKYRPWSMT